MSKGSFSALAVTTLLFTLSPFQVRGDLRFGSSPKNNFRVQNENNAIPFATTRILYMEPSTFGYDGLEDQKANNYDNFLRSNVDNEQDERDFETEDGLDMLPFRTTEAESFGEVLTLSPGEELTIPLRWNNPHASECEINIWIRNNEVVVPIKKPVCCGEGYQDAVITATIPTDFNQQIISKVPGFEGCLEEGDCVMQLYAHSVEPRIYAVGVPLIIESNEDLSAIPRATDESQIEDAAMDPGMNYTDWLTIPTCRGSFSTDANLASAIPRYARHTSDVYNHAYQNSDFSPYMGQQHERISMELQAAAIIEMLPANRGELGASILSDDLTDLAAQLRDTVNNYVQRYETTANNIFGNFGNQLKYDLDEVGNQEIKDCFQCAEVGSTNHVREQTQTYIPSFALPASVVDQVRNNVQSDYRNIINTEYNAVMIYNAVLESVMPQFEDAMARGLNYMPAPLKTSAATMPDATGFKKIDANGNTDDGTYAATMAKNTAFIDPASVHVSLRRDGDTDSTDYTEGLDVELDEELLARINDDNFLPPNPDDDVSGAGNVDDDDNGDGLGSGASLSAISYFIAVSSVAVVASLL